MLPPLNDESSAQANPRLTGIRRAAGITPSPGKPSWGPPAVQLDIEPLSPSRNYPPVAVGRRAAHPRHLHALTTKTDDIVLFPLVRGRRLYN